MEGASSGAPVPEDKFKGQSQCPPGNHWLVMSTWLCLTW